MFPVKELFALFSTKSYYVNTFAFNVRLMIRKIVFDLKKFINCKLG